MADTRLGKIGITVKEPWAADISYEVLDVTLYAVEDGGDGCSYTALRDNIGVTPGTDPNTWVKSTQAGQSIYDLAVKYHHFVGTEEEFEADYQAALQAARDAAAGASAVEAQVEAAEALRVEAETGRADAESARQSAEASRASAETARGTAEAARQSAESGRASAETARVTAEQGRASAESDRVSAEAARAAAETDRVSDFSALKTDMETAIGQADAATAAAVATNNQIQTAEASRVSAEQGRVSAENARASAESARATAETGRATAETARATAEGQRATAEGQRVTAENARVSAESGRDTAESGRVSAEAARVSAETARESQASSDHTMAESDHAIAAEDHATLDEKIAHKADIDGSYDGMTVGLAKNLESWEGESLMAEDPQSLAVFTTGGDMSIDSSVPAQLVEVAAKTDFSATSLLATGFNLLRLTSANGPAKAVGAGYYFPVPALPFGSINTAEQPNGVLFTSRTGENLRPTVYFKKLSQGVPTSVTDGTACSYSDAVSGDKSYRFYNPTEPGYIIVSGITWADTCAHIGWSKRYDEFIAPDDASDAGHAIALTAAIAAAHSFGKLLTVGASADRIRRISATQVQWETEVDRVQPAWTNTLQEDGETYLHTATIAAMKADGAAQFMTVSRQLAISGTTISYTDTSATAYTDFVKYEKAAHSTGTVNLATALAVEDWGLIILLDAVGEAFTTIAYAQNIPDNVRALVSARLSGQMEIVAQAFAELYSWAEDITRRLFGAQDHPIYRATEVDAQIYRIGNIPMEVHGAGAPSAAVIPVDWDKLCPGVTWRGVPLAPGMVYTDDTNSKVYKAKAVLTNAVSDWILLN